MAVIYLGIGSNLGNREKNILSAINLLNTNAVKVLKRSNLIETLPVGGPANQGNFLNGVLKASTNLAPEELLTLLKQIEEKLGRIKTICNGPRPIDIDILLYDQIQLQTPQLTIPHPRMFERDFVLKPLEEIAPHILEDSPHAHH